MSRSTRTLFARPRPVRHARIQLDRLGDRAMPTVFVGPGGMYSPALGELSTADRTSVYTNVYSAKTIDVRVANGTLFVTGTPLDDTATVSNESDVTTTNSKQGTRTYEYGETDFTRVEFNGGGGADTFTNDSPRRLHARGGDGDDRLTGGTFHDTLIGDLGADTLTGRSEADVIWGDGEGQVSGTAPDGSNGCTMGDTMSGDDGNDKLYGGFGGDSISGGNQNDTLNGGDQNDLLDGGAGADVVGQQEFVWEYPFTPSVEVTASERGDDRLFGGTGNDTLRGGAGDDGLFGGLGRNSLAGGADDDRVLTWSAADDRVADLGSNDARIQFNDTTTTTNRTSKETDPATGDPITAPLRYAAAAWADAEIRTVDDGLEWAHRLTANTRFLKPAADVNAVSTFVREGAYVPWTAAEAMNNVPRQVANNRGPFYAGWNGASGIAFNDRGVAAGAEAVQEITIHELAHNWPLDPGMWNDWLAASGWQNTPPPAGQAGQFTRSGDARWWFRNTAADSFYRDYSMFNPAEDWSTAWEAYRLWRLGRLDVATAAAMADKFAIIDRLVTWMSQN